MKVIIDDREYSAATAVELIDEIKGMNWAATADTDAEGYIAIQADTLERMWERKLVLPEGNTEARAIAMFEAIDALGGWEFHKGTMSNKPLLDMLAVEGAKLFARHAELTEMWKNDGGNSKDMAAHELHEIASQIDNLRDLYDSAKSETDPSFFSEYIDNQGRAAIGECVIDQGGFDA